MNLNNRYPFPSALDNHEAQYDDEPFAYDPLGVSAAQAVAAHLDRLAVDGGSLVEMRPIRRHYGRAVLGLVGLSIFVLGVAAVLYGVMG